MCVFSEEWVQQIKKRYERCEDFQRPPLRVVATDPKLQPMRDQIESWVKNLSEEQQKKVIQNLRSTENFLHTYHELVVGSLLKDFEFLPEYEKDLNGQTPDWYVSTEENDPPFIVEVFTSNVSDTQRGDELQTRDLQGRLRQIPLDFGLHISLNDEIVELTPRLNKKIANDIRKWLIQNNPSVEVELNLEELTAKVISRDRGYTGVQYAGFSKGFGVNPKPLRKNIEDKVAKYKMLIASIKMPLVIAVVADFLTGFGSDELKDVLFGQEVFNVTFNKKTMEHVNQTVSQKNNGLFLEKPLLSAAIWIWQEYFSEWKMKTFVNPIAQNPLSESQIKMIGG